VGKTRTPTERIASLQEKIAKKRTTVEGYNLTLANTQKNIDAANKTIEGYEKQISALEADLLAKTLHKRGIKISDVSAAIEAGLFDNSASEKPPDMSEKEPEIKDNNGATYSTENIVVDSDIDIPEKEDFNNE